MQELRNNVYNFFNETNIELKMGNRAKTRKYCIVTQKSKKNIGYGEKKSI